FENDTTSRTLSFTNNTTAYKSLALAVTGGDGAQTFTAVVHHSGSPDETFTGLSAPDWFNTGTTPAIKGIGRVVQTASGITFDGGVTAGTPSIFEVDLTLADTSHAVTGVDIQRATGAGELGVFGISGQNATAPQQYVNPVLVAQNSTIDLEFNGAT